MELEAIGGGQIPPELVLLPHDQRKTPAKSIGPIPWRVAEHARRAARGIDDPRQHLERGRFAGAVGSKKGHHLPWFDGESYPIDGTDFFGFTAVESAHSSQQTLPLLIDAVYLREVLR